MPSMAEATDWVFSLFDVALGQKVHFDIPQYVQPMLHGLTCVLFCVHLSLLTAQGVNSQ